MALGRGGVGDSQKERKSRFTVAILTFRNASILSDHFGVDPLSLKRKHLEINEDGG